MDTLDFLASLPPDIRAEREAALHVVEDEGMAQMRLMPGARELAQFLDSKGVPRCGGGCSLASARVWNVLDLLA